MTLSAVPGLCPAHRHDRWTARIDAPSDDRLQGVDHLSQRDDRVVTEMRASPVTATTADLDAKGIGGRRQWPRLSDHLTDLEAPIDVGPEDRTSVVQHAAVENCRCTGSELLGGLQHHEHVTVRRLARQEMRSTDRPGRVHVVTASVHHPWVLRRVLQPRLLFDRQRIDVAAHGDDRRGGVTSRQTRNDPGTGNALDHGRVQSAELLMQTVGGSVLLIGQLGMPMQVAA